MNQNNLRLPEQNSITLVGRLTRDPEVRFTGKGDAVCSFDIAVNRRFKSTAGEWKDDTTFIGIVVWGDSGKRCGDRLKKGLPVHVEGRLQSRQWETKEGQKRTTIEVIARRVQFLSKADSPQEAGAPVGKMSGDDAAETAASVPDEDEIPF
ncbi:MAG: single-stranded DNA-binding protein [Elusimicrobia bacterium]|nr:single-stranded DNA-binding protein [Elusimicrobiota bacterium]